MFANAAFCRRHGRRLVALLLAAPLLLAIAPHAYAQTQTQTVTTSVALQTDGAVQICEEGARCRLNRHPVAAGRVREIIAGNFINTAPASWIALGERTVSLCYLNGASGAITCAPIANGAEFARGTLISWVSLDDGAHTLRFAARNGNEAAWQASYSPYGFMASLSAATELLARHAARHDNGAGGIANPAAAGGTGADICALSDNGGVTCTGADSAVEGGAAAGTGAVLAGQASAPNRAALQAPAATAAADPNQITTVETGSGEVQQGRSCRAVMHDRIAQCNEVGRRFGDRSRQACVSSAQASLRDCNAAGGGTN